MPGPHQKMVTQEESATVIEGEGEGVARERVEGRGVGAETGACGVRQVCLDSPLNACDQA